MSIKRVRLACLTVVILTTTIILIASVPDRTESKERIQPETCSLETSSSSSASESFRISRYDMPRELHAVSYCESRHRQYNQSGEPLWSQEGTPDLGRWQINIPTWGNKAEELGYNLRTERGNFQMALWIYKTNGLKDWSPSAECLYNNFGLVVN